MAGWNVWRVPRQSDTSRLTGWHVGWSWQDDLEGVRRVHVLDRQLRENPGESRVLATFWKGHRRSAWDWGGARGRELDCGTALAFPQGNGMNPAGAGRNDPLRKSHHSSRQFRLSASPRHLPHFPSTFALRGKVQKLPPESSNLPPAAAPVPSQAPTPELRLLTDPQTLQASAEPGLPTLPSAAPARGHSWSVARTHSCGTRTR